MIDAAAIRRLLVIKLRAIGDVLLSTVVLDNLRAAFPHAAIDFLTESPSREVIEGNPAVNSVMVFHSRHQSGISLIREVRRREYDLVIDLFGNPRSAIVTRLSGARYRAGYRFSWRQSCYNIVADPRGGEVHNTEFNLDALRAMGLSVTNNGPVFPVGPDADAFAGEFFLRNSLGGALVVALNAGGGWYTKRWRTPSFAELGRRLAATYGAKILILWGPGERDDAEALVREIGGSSVLIPPASLKQLAAVAKRCSVVVTNDSGPMHIAAAMGTPVVAIFGPTNPRLQGPVGPGHRVVANEALDCLGCNLTKCPIGNICMTELSVDAVESAVARVLGEPSLHRDHLLKN
jgi:heptosyltransferase-3